MSKSSLSIFSSDIHVIIGAPTFGENVTVGDILSMNTALIANVVEVFIDCDGMLVLLQSTSVFRSYNYIYGKIIALLYIVIDFTYFVRME